VRRKRYQVCRIGVPLWCDGHALQGSESKASVEVRALRNRVSEGQRCRGSHRLGKV